jgi:transcriptional regulator with XRE-family HTH domain
MTNEEKLDIILNHKKIKNTTIAEKLEVSHSLVSQWRNKYKNKLKKIHLYALEATFDIPYEIFEKDSFETKEKIIEKLTKNCNTTHNESVVKKSFPKKLIGKWYCYNYNSHNTLDIDIIEISRFEVKVYNIDSKKVILKGYPLAINNYQTLLILSKNTEPYSIQITINNDLINSQIFYATASLKTYKNKDALMFCLFTKERLEVLSAMEIMGDRHKNLLNINDSLIENIETYKQDKFKVIDKVDSLKSLIGNWNLYFDNEKSKNIIKIDNNLLVDWIKDGHPYKEGELLIDKNAVILKFDNNTYHSTYFMFIKKHTNIKLVYYIGPKYISNMNVFAIGVMSKNKLTSKELDNLLPTTNSINLTKIYKKLVSFLETTWEQTLKI